MASTSSSFIKFTSLSGCRQDQGPVCHLLEIDQARILLDCGSGPALQVDHLQSLRRLVGKQRIDAILVSHATLKHIGGLPFVFGQLGTDCPILGTVPIHHLGLVTLYDAYQSYCLSNGSPPTEDTTTLDHIDKAFEHMTMLRYAQPFHLANTGIVISALPAGHTVGGTIWKISKGPETVVYAPAFNHKRESHLDGAPFELISKPTLVITSAEQALQIPVARKARDDALLDTINGALKAGGNVLIPTETAGRTLELVQLLNYHFDAKRAKRVPSLVLLSHQSRRTVELAKGMLEWMGQAMMKAFEEDRTNPFELGNFRLCHTLDELSSLPEPKVVLASLDSLDAGYARSLFISWAAQTKSLILLLRQPVPGSLAHSIMAEGKSPKVTVKIFERVPLEPAELEALKRAQEEERERKNAERAFAELKRRLQAEEEAAIMDEDDGEEEGPSAMNVEMDFIDSAKALREIYWTDYRTDWIVDLKDPLYTSFLDAVESPHFPLLNGKRDVTSLFAAFRFHQFPNHHQQAGRKADNYGEAVDPSDFGPKEEVKPIETREKVEIETRANIEIPTKLIDYSKEVTVRCGRRVLDFTGLADGRSLKTILAQMSPRRLILAGGTAPATDYLQQHLLFTTSQQLDNAETEFECYAPHPMETLRISMASNTKQAILAESLIDGLQIGLLKDLELAFVQAQVHYRQDDKMDVDEEETVDVDRMMVLQPATSFKRRDPLMIGELRLGELRLLISQSLGLPADFVSGGDLVCGTGPEGMIRIRKEGDSLSLEGCPSEDYYRIRDLLYSQIAIV